MKTVIVRYPYERDFTLTVPDAYTIDDVFDEFNYGSGCERDEFVDAGIRSFSVGDLVHIDDCWHRCESVGWKILSDKEMWDYMTAIESKLIQKREVNPELPAWFAVNEVARG